MSTPTPTPAPAPTPAPTPHGPTYHWRDPATWVNLLTVLGALVAVVHPGFSLSGYIQAASVLAAGIVTAAISLGKHNAGLVAILIALVGTIEQALGYLPKSKAPDAPASPAKTSRRAGH